MRLTLLTLLCSLNAFAQYNDTAGHNAPAAASVSVERVNKKGEKYLETEVREAPRDNYGNAAGAKYDLAVDGAFGGQRRCSWSISTGRTSAAPPRR